MIIDAGETERAAILGAMEAIAEAHGERGVSAIDRMTIDAAREIVFGRKGPVTPVSCSPEQLAAAIDDVNHALLAVRVLAVMSLVDGELDAARNSLVGDYAAALGVNEDYLQILTESVTGELTEAKACIIRKNAESFPELDTTGIEEDAVAPLLPYRNGREDPELEARYQALGELPAGSFGRAFFDHFDKNGFAFPGNPNGLAEGFTTPHDSSHVISGYSTSQLGELCVSTFIGAMHPDHPMAAEVLPVLFSWHLGVKLNDIANSATGYFDPRRFWTAWDRGNAARVDLVDADWDFWGATTVPLEELRTHYGVPPVDPELLA